MTPLTAAEIMTRIGAALLCGALVGIERERKQRPAGFRTMILISLGCCGFVLIGLEAVTQIAIQTPITVQPNVPIPGQAEISRILQGLMGGIGFVGAGAVLQRKKAVRGITTAAAVWVVAALGSACGLGLYPIAIVLGLCTLFTLIVLEIVEEKYFPDPHGHHERDNGNDHWPHESTDRRSPASDPSPAPAQRRGH